MAKATEHYRKSDWYSELSAYIEVMERRRVTDGDVDKASDRFYEACAQIMARPVRSMDDLVILAGIAAHWNSPLCVDHYRLDLRSISCLVFGVLKLAGGFELDDEGRLLP